MRRSWKRIAAMFAVGTLGGALVLGLGRVLDADADREPSPSTWITESIAVPAHAEDDHGSDAGGHGETPDVHGSSAAHGADDAHGDDHGEHHEGAPHLPSLIDLVIAGLPGGADSATAKVLKRFAPSIFGVLVAIFLAVLAQAASRNLTLVPGRLQNAAEILIGGLHEFILGIIGPQGERFVPFLGTLFIFIWSMNMVGLLPFGFAPTASLNMTVALAAIVFLYSTFASIRMNGIVGHLFHLAGEPRDVIGWALVPLLFPLHVIGEIAKPFSLSVRLFCNIFGEETLIAVFVGLGAAALAFLQPIPIGIPFQIPFVFLSLLLGTIQALVFMLLSTIYFALVMPHGHDEH